MHCASTRRGKEEQGGEKVFFGSSRARRTISNSARVRDEDAADAPKFLSPSLLPIFLLSSQFKCNEALLFPFPSSFKRRRRNIGKGASTAAGGGGGGRIYYLSVVKVAAAAAICMWEKVGREESQPYTVQQHSSDMMECEHVYEHVRRMAFAAEDNRIGSPSHRRPP